jgi:hypothetical protein
MMFDSAHIIGELARCRLAFKYILSDLTEDEYTWKPSSDKWNILEIVCHLYDEEREDFRARIKYTIDPPGGPIPLIDPQGWATTRKYGEQDFAKMTNKFLNERKSSLNWLESLKYNNWDRTITHPTLGKMSGSLFLCNWLAHDYQHIRQILSLKHQYLQMKTGESLTYAGNWQVSFQ